MSQLKNILEKIFEIFSMSFFWHFGQAQNSYHISANIDRIALQNCGHKAKMGLQSPKKIQLKNIQIHETAVFQSCEKVKSVKVFDKLRPQNVKP